MSSAPATSNEYATSSHDDGMDWLVHAQPTAMPEPMELVTQATRLSLFSLVRSAFDEAHRAGTKRRDIAERLGVSVELVGRNLRGPKNLTIDTATKILFVLGRELTFGSVKIGARRAVGAEHWSWMAGTGLQRPTTVHFAHSDKVSDTQVFIVEPAVNSHHEITTAAAKVVVGGPPKLVSKSPKVRLISMEGAHS